MYIFLSNLIPLSVNPNKKQKYYEGIIESFHKYYPSTNPYENKKLYGFVYYFHRKKTSLDADNISKPIWDALIGEAYFDDHQIIFRSAGVINLLDTEIKELDVSNLPDDIFLEFIDMINEEKDHILYIEIGSYDHSLFHFGFENERIS